MSAFPPFLIYIPIREQAERYAELVRARFKEADPWIASTPEEAEPHIARCEILLGWMVPADLLRRARRLRWMQKTGAGVDDVLKPGILPPSAVVTRSDGAILAPRMIEYVLGAIYAHTQHFRRAWDQQRTCDWRPYLVNRAAGNTMAIAGLGDIGRLLAARARDSGFRVVGWRRSDKPEPTVDELYSGETGFRDMLSLADYVVSILPSTPATDRLFDADAFSAMRPGAYFINVGRGNAVDEAALAEALESGHLSGATLDVFQREPLPADSPLWRAPNLALTPHVAGPIIPDEVAPYFLDNLDRYLQGKPLLRTIDPAAGY